MVCQYAFRGAEIFSSGMCALKVYKQNVVAGIIYIDVIGGPRATPIFQDITKSFRGDLGMTKDDKTAKGHVSITFISRFRPQSLFLTKNFGFFSG